jgi:5-methylcytosine-specific restriction endonuclease McrA
VSVTSVPPSLRNAVRLRAGDCCEYCGIHEDDAFEAHEADHIIAVQHRGVTTADNLAFACWECNRRKGLSLSSVDPDTGEIVRLYNPRRDVWSEHFFLDGVNILYLFMFISGIEGLQEDCLSQYRVSSQFAHR